MRIFIVPIIFLLSVFGLQAQNPCEIFDLTVVTGDCNPNANTYVATINFQVENPTSDSFKVWGNNVPIGIYPLTALPLTINSFPYNGGPNDVVKVCMLGNENCCRIKEFAVPACIITQPCEIFNLVVDPGDCTSDSTYNLHVDFDVANSAATHFDVYANGNFFGNFAVANLPVLLNNFPYNGGNNDVIKVCMSQNVACCKTLEFAVPTCILPNQPCEIFNLVVDPGDCTSDSTYSLHVNFQVANSSATHFDVYANGNFFGNYAVASLPIVIQNFPYNGGNNDVIKVCMNQNVTCCKTLEFAVPACILPNQPCEIFGLVVDPGDCTSDSTYNLHVNFQVANSSATHFDVYANGNFFGNFAVANLPVLLENFPYNGGANDVIKVCMSQNVACCKILEFPVPACVSGGGDCEIVEMSVITGECHEDSTYTVKINFDVINPTNQHFDVWGNGEYLGNFPLSALPLIIEHFPYNGGPNDVIKVCINDNPNCCKIKEFPVPACISGSGDCEIVEMSVITGECHEDSTYTVKINFEVVNATNQLFDVWGNGEYLGNFPLSALPLIIEHFPYNGGPNDVIKVCINDNPNCCKIKEFPVPACASGSGDCEIGGMSVITGDCHEDSTYTVKINFDVINPTNQLFDVWGNGEYLGNFPLSALPLIIEHFPYNGGANDVIKVCINDNPNCCKIIEFPVPDCAQGACHIYDLKVKTTACLCGQFFAVLTFNHNNTGNGGFDVVGNGVNYGNYPYENSQPVIIGPLDGDGTTKYEFAVQDHNHPDCHDAVELGIIDCPESPTVDIPFAAGSLSILPNPASEWITISAQLNGNLLYGSGDITIRSIDGRTVKTLQVATAASFNVNVGDLVPGTYQLILETSAGRLQNTFIKL